MKKLIRNVYLEKIPLDMFLEQDSGPPLPLSLELQIDRRSRAVVSYAVRGANLKPSLPAKIVTDRSP
ncbi:MAG: hypothetical protein WC809_00460 [Sinimarinibacterium sp.]|jgi:hypothetical protein